MLLSVIHKGCQGTKAQAGIKLPGEISITSDTQTTPPLWQKVKN